MSTRNQVFFAPWSCDFGGMAGLRSPAKRKVRHAHSFNPTSAPSVLVHAEVCKDPVRPKNCAHRYCMMCFKKCNQDKQDKFCATCRTPILSVSKRGFTKVGRTHGSAVVQSCLFLSAERCFTVLQWSLESTTDVSFLTVSGAWPKCVCYRLLTVAASFMEGWNTDTL
jgi:hypothetical protein